MCRIHTPGVVALVANVHPGGNVAMRQDVREAMRPNRLTVNGALTVTVVTDRRVPFPAVALFSDIHFRPKAVDVFLRYVHGLLWFFVGTVPQPIRAVWGVLFGAVKRSFASESIIAQSVNAVNRQFD